MQEGGPFLSCFDDFFLDWYSVSEVFGIFCGVRKYIIFQSISIDETLSPSLIKGEDE
jgi:hypothetical protein